MVARAVVKAVGTEIPLRLLNWRNEAVSIPKGTMVVETELVADAEIATEMVAAMQENSMEIPEDQRHQLVNHSGHRLNQEDKEQLFALCLKYADLFVTGANAFGCTGKLTHRIDPEDSPPIRQQARRVPPFRKEEVKKLLDYATKGCYQTIKESLGFTNCLGQEERWPHSILC